MSNIKEKMTEVIQSQQEDATYEKSMRELAFERMIERGLVDSRSGRVISDEDMECRFRTWQKYGGPGSPQLASRYTQLHCHG